MIKYNKVEMCKEIDQLIKELFPERLFNLSKNNYKNDLLSKNIGLEPYELLYIYFILLSRYSLNPYNNSIWLEDCSTIDQFADYICMTRE